MGGKESLTPFRRKIRDSPIKGQYTLEGGAMSSLSLTDKLPNKLHTLFVGINPGIRSAKIGHYYAGHSNAFWKLIHASGLWPIPLTAENDDDMVKVGFGFTDVAKRPTPGADTLQRHDFQDGSDRIDNIVRAYKPRTVAFVSKRAAREYLRQPLVEVAYGVQKKRIGTTDVFYLPSTSGQSYADTTYAEKLEEFSKLAVHVRRYFSFKEKSN
jgi:double-stranded uracil-DNA glycosylase